MLLFISAYVLSVPFFIALLILGVVFESYDKDALAVLTGIASLVVAYFMYDLSLIGTAYAAAVYLVVGVVWSFWRYKRFVDSRVESCNVEGTSEHARNYMLTEIKLENTLGRITSWIIVWPFSMVENVTHDVVRLIRTLVSETLKSAYNKIYTNAIKNVKPL